MCGKTLRIQALERITRVQPGALASRSGLNLSLDDWHCRRDVRARMLSAAHPCPSDMIPTESLEITMACAFNPGRPMRPVQRDPIHTSSVGCTRLAESTGTRDRIEMYQTPHLYSLVPRTLNLRGINQVGSDNSGLRYPHGWGQSSSDLPRVVERSAPAWWGRKSAIFHNEHAQLDLSCFAKP